MTKPVIDGVANAEGAPTPALPRRESPDIYPVAPMLAVLAMEHRDDRQPSASSGSKDLR